MSEAVLGQLIVLAGVLLAGPINELAKYGITTRQQKDKNKQQKSKKVFSSLEPILTSGNIAKLAKFTYPYDLNRPEIKRIRVYLETAHYPENTFSIPRLETKRKKLIDLLECYIEMLDSGNHSPDRLRKHARKCEQAHSDLFRLARLKT